MEQINTNHQKFSKIKKKKSKTFQNSKKRNQKFKKKPKKNSNRLYNTFKKIMYVLK